MNTNVGMRFWKEQFGRFFTQLFKCFAWGKSRGTKMRSRSNSMTSDSGSEMPPKINTRSLSASEGIAQRTGQVMSTEKEVNSEPIPSPRKSISFAKPLPRQEEIHADPSSIADMLKKEARMRSNSSIDRPSPSPITTSQPVLATMPSYSKSNDVSESTETSEVQPSRATRHKSGFGVWEKLRASRRRYGGRDYQV